MSREKFSILGFWGKSKTTAWTHKWMAKLISWVIIASDLSLTCSNFESQSTIPLFELTFARTKSLQYPLLMHVSNHEINDKSLCYLILWELYLLSQLFFSCGNSWHDKHQPKWNQSLLLGLRLLLEDSTLRWCLFQHEVSKGILLRCMASALLINNLSI